MKKYRKTIYDFMLQGSLYETLTSKINRLCNFSYQTCVDIILSGAPSNDPSFLFKKARYYLPGCSHHLVNVLVSVVIGRPFYELPTWHWNISKVQRLKVFQVFCTTCAYLIIFLLKKQENKQQDWLDSFYPSNVWFSFSCLHDANTACIWTAK